MIRRNSSITAVAGLLIFLLAATGCSSDVVATGSVSAPAPSQVAGEPETAAEVAVAETASPAVLLTTPTSAATLEGRWGLERIGVAAAWELVSGPKPVLVAVLDTGIAPDAPFADRIAGAMDFSGEGTVYDEHGHGTHMAGTIAAIAPNAQLLNAKVANRRGRCETDAVARAIRWAADNGASVINVSLEVAPSAGLESAVQYAWDLGAIVIAAAGNGGTDAPAYPAAYSAALAVAGTNQADGLAVLSNHGNWVDLAAPGYKIYAEKSGTEYGYETGTSPAAAHVSGVAALLYGVAVDGSQNGVVNDEVASALTSTAEPMAVPGTGYGIVNAFAAVQMLTN